MLIVLCGESASGKSAISDILINEYRLKKVISYTTREPRKGEIDGVDYYFVNNDEFLNMMYNKYNDERKQLIESFLYLDHYYGTSLHEYLNSDFSIMEVNGLKFLLASNYNLLPIYIKTSEKTRIERMNKDKKRSRKDNEARIIEDRKRFKDVEQIENIIIIENDKGTNIHDVAEKIYHIVKENKNK